LATISRRFAGGTVRQSTPYFSARWYSTCLGVAGNRDVVGVVALPVRRRRVVWEVGVGDADPPEEGPLPGVLGDERLGPVGHPGGRVRFDRDGGRPALVGGVRVVEGRRLGEAGAHLGVVLFEPEPVVAPLDAVVPVADGEFDVVEAVVRPVEVAPEVPAVRRVDRRGLDALGVDVRIAVVGAEVGLPQEARRVPRVPEQFGDRHLGFRKRDAVPPAPVGARVPPGQERAACGRTERMRAVSLLEAHAVARQPVEVWRRDHVVVVASERVGALFVGVDEEDVRAVGHRPYPGVGQP
jgi:hypothetical protein